jgi:small GTP-binding protein
MLDYKCALIGSSGVGKTSTFNTIFEINTNQVSSTIGPTSQTKTIKSGNAIINIKVLDTAGTERFRKISRGYFKDSEGILLMFDLTNRKSFEELTEWMKDIKILCNKNVSILLIGNKKDLTSKREITKQEAEKFAKCFNLEYIEISSFHKQEVNLMFRKLIKNLLQRNLLNNLKI